MIRVCRLLLSVLIVLSGLPALHAEIIYVDNILGDDAYDGTSATPINPTSGPVRTFGRGLQLLKPGLRLNITNTGLPYFGSLELNGAKHSGTPLSPMFIDGNGAEINGAIPVPKTGWQQVGQSLWKFTPFRKGHYLLILDNKALPETVVPRDSLELPDLAEHHWAAWQGAIYFKASTLEVPADLELWFATRSMGITLYDVHDIIVRDIKVRHFRIDGINAHDRCKNTVLERITAEENGRAGVVAAGSSKILLVKPTVNNNLRHSVLVLENASVQIDDETNVAPKPTVPE